MEQNQEKKYCARLGWALLAVVVWAAVWQFALAFADQALAWGLGVVMPYGLYYLLALVGHYLVSLPAAFALCRSVPRTPLAPVPVGARRIGRWFVIGAALMWLCSLLGSSLNDLAYRLPGRAPVDQVSEAFSLYPTTVVLVGA